MNKGNIITRSCSTTATNKNHNNNNNDRNEEIVYESNVINKSINHNMILSQDSNLFVSSNLSPLVLLQESKRKCIFLLLFLIIYYYYT